MPGTDVSVTQEHQDHEGAVLGDNSADNSPAADLVGNDLADDISADGNFVRKRSTLIALSYTNTNDVSGAILHYMACC
jgi:hypothetical protein